MAHRSASKRLQRRPVALRAIFTAHGPTQIVRRTVPRESTKIDGRPISVRSRCAGQ
jgi:phosphoenolpyruvate carboxylase